MSELCDAKSVHHPFDNEGEVSLQHLYKSLWNHVTLGQWELARVCLEKLYNERKLLKKPLKDILRAVIDRPTFVGNGSPSVPSPLHLSWLCLVDYLQLFVSQEDKLPSQISLTVEFHLLLYLSNNCKTSHVKVLQELDNYYANIVYGDTLGFKNDTLSSNSLQFLKTLLNQDPQFGHAIISHLISKAKSLLENNQTLQQLYIDGIKQLLEKLEKYNGISSTKKSDVEMIDSLKNQLYNLLSLMNPTSDMVSLSGPLDSLFTTLIQHSRSLGVAQLNIGNLYSSLLQRPTSHLLQKFCESENNLRFSRDVLLERDVAFGGKSLLNQAAFVCLSQCGINDRTEAMKFLFFHALNGNHVLENVVETALLFIKDGDFAKVTVLLSKFQVLKPLVLLLGWPYCYSCENARNLLDTLWDQKAPVDHPLLYQTCEKLAYQVQLVQWCLEKAGLLLASNEAGSTHHQQASEMFQGLESHSVLRVLHKSISLAQLPEKEVFDLLQKRPVFSSKSDDTESDHDESDTLHEGQSSKSLHPEVERDLILYHSFCAIRSFMDCVFDQRCGDDCQRPASPYDDSNLPAKLSRGRQHLTKIFPLTYRVEILENIFSLLFTTYEDLYSENAHHDSDALDTGDDDTKSMNTSLTGSMESLASITSADTASVDTLGQFSPYKDQGPDSPVRLKGHTRSGSHDTKGIKTTLNFGATGKEGVGIRSEPTTPTKTKGHSRTGSHDLSIQVLQNSARALPSLVTSASKKPKEECSDKSAPSSPIKNARRLSCQHAGLGFIVDNEVVLEYLKTLKDCLLDVNAAKLIERQSGKSSIYSNPDWLYTSIGNNVLEQRISRLTQYIVEAQWRYQLVSWNGEVKVERSTKGKPRPSQTSSSLLQEKAQLKSEPEEKLQSDNLPKRLDSKDSADTDQNSDESSSYQSQELTTGTEDNLSYKASKKQSRPLRHGRKSSLTEGLVIKDDSSVARMLSSPETLIYMCLRKDSYDRAQQVIKMFQLKGKPTANAATFAEKFSNAVRELSMLQPRTRQNLSGHNSSSKTLGAIAMAAASGVSSTVTSNLVDQLLTSSIPSPLMLYDVDVSDDDISKSLLYGYVHPALIPVMVCVDLACTVNVPVDVCRNLLETANSRLLQVEEEVATKQESSLVGVTEVLFDLYQLLTQDHKSTSTAFLSTQPNLVDFLLGRHPLKVKSRNLYSNHENEQKKSFEWMRQTLEEGDANIVAIEKATSKASSPGKKSRGASFSVVEKVLSVRVALKELQNSYSCTSEFAMSNVGSKKDKLDYLRSLLNHVDTIAYLLLHWQSKPDDLSGFSKDVATGMVSKASNPFVVLNKGIAETFGKPMFDKNVSPKRLEGICKQLNINLVKVIVDNCCPHITSCGLSSEKGYSWPSSKVFVLNNGSHWLENAREPNVVAKELLTEMINLLTDVAQTNNGLVDASCAITVVTSPRFTSIAQGTRELQRVDLDLLQTSEAKFCFFINVLNLLIAHSSLLMYSVEDEEEPRGRRRTVSYLSCISSSGGFNDKQSVSSLDRISFLKHHYYSIGQLGPTSAFDILFMIIRSGLIPPTMFGSAIQLCYPERPADDPKRKYKPSHQDKRVVFAVSDGCLSSPDLQVYDVEALEFQLNAAAMSYVNSHVTIEEGQIVLPELLKWYRSDFTQETFGELKKTNETTNASFLLLIEPYLNDKKAALLQGNLSNIKITYTPFCWMFGYRFDVSSLDHSESATTLHQSSSVSDSLHLSLELSGTGSVGSIESRGKFRPNDTILEYLSKESPLVSTLVELVCPTTTGNSLDKGVALLSKELGFNGALKKVEDFPVLQRAIASRFYCIAEFLTLASGDLEISGSYELVGAVSKAIEEEHVDVSPTIKLCSLVFSATNSAEVRFAYKRCSDFFLRQANFYCLLELIRMTDFNGDGSNGETLDYLLVSALLGKGCSNDMFPKRLDALLSDLNIPSFGFTHKWHKKPWTLLAQIKDNNQLAQLVLSHLKEYKAKVGLDLLKLAISQPPSNIALRKELEHRKKELNIHGKIAQCAKAPQLRATEALFTPQSPGALTQWQGVAAKTVDDPGQIMEFLISIQQYELAGSWAEHHGLPTEYYKVIKERQIKFLLESSTEDSMKAYCILEGIQEQHMALEICQSLLHQKLHVSQILFIIQFMLTNLQQHLSPIRMQELHLTKMGAKALLCIPEMARSSYEHLVSRPNLLLEQLLMNLKVEWAAQVFSRLQVDLAMMKEGTVEGGHNDCTVQAFDSLLATYAAKALEFQVVQTQPSPEITLQAKEEVLSSSPSAAAGYGGRATPVRDIPPSIKDFRNSLQQSVSSLAREPFKQYVPPAIPPSKEEWIPDAQALKCIICQEAFSMFNRRHHCRRCGRVVCGACSKHNSVVQNYGDTPVRVCDSCYTRYEGGTETVEKTDVSASPLRAEAGSLGKSLGQDSVVDNYGTSPYGSEIKTESEVINKWKLSLDTESNSATREEFYFEQAPSSSLCIAILDLHSDNLACGQLMLDLCNTLSKKLVPITPGVRNDEVDHTLIISMIRYLLFNAKLKMTKAGETGGLELCDTYLSHVELMKFLVESNCGDIPSLQDLTRPDSARRLRDRFIEDERLTLAMEVSTKCGLEPSSVWAASGFACLQAGDFTAAREKFAMCMKSSDGKIQQKQYSQYLDKIIDILQSSPLISYSQSTDELLSPLRGMAEHCKSFTHSNILDNKRFDECLYYLHAYGNDLSVVTFYGRHGHLKLACRYILDKKCHSDVFVEGLLMRIISKGNVSNLKDQMETSDPTLQSWTPYLTASCRFLNKRGYHHLLYDLQLFMKDHFRAAQTCIRFFEGTAGSSVMSYNDLYSRLDYLNKARSHIEAVIIEKKSPRGSSHGATSWLRSHSSLRRKSSDEVHVTINLSELTSYVNTINLQIEVTNFVHKCCLEGGNVSGLRASNDGEKLPTLFGNGHAKAELAIQVLLAGSTIQEGFSLASRIIQDYNLPAPRVYVDSGRTLARQYRFAHIQQLLKCVAEIGLISDKCHDEIILACIRIISADQSQAKHVENLIKLLKNDSNKIDAFLLCGKLRSAYLIAVKESNVEAVQMIAEEAQKNGQNKTLSLCKKWLSQNQRATGNEGQSSADQVGSRK